MPGLTSAVGVPLAVDVQVLGTGTTTVRAAVWTAGAAAPATPTRSWTALAPAVTEGHPEGGDGAFVHRIV